MQAGRTEAGRFGLDEQKPEPKISPVSLHRWVASSIFFGFALFHAA
jgi:hypothetical protein